MKKLLSILICTLINIGAYSQKLVSLSKTYDEYNHPRVKVTGFNYNYSHYIRFVQIAMVYIDTNNEQTEATMDFTNKYFKPRADFNVYIYKRPPQFKKALRLYIKKVVYDDGSYVTNK